MTTVIAPCAMGVEDCMTDAFTIGTAGQIVCEALVIGWVSLKSL